MSEVYLTTEKTDLYMRTVSEVITKNKMNVNKKMVEIGMAVHYPFQRGCEDYAALEKVAKKNKHGVWADPSFDLPWNYREKQVNTIQWWAFNGF
jgi:endonuclease YncB( thermonuclease family)